MTVAAHRFDNEKRRRPDHHARQAMLTPSYILEPVRELMRGFGLDPCTEPDNPTGADQFFCLPADGCSEIWLQRNVWCNPPYGEAKDRWVDRCILAGRLIPVALLIPAHTETRTFQRAFQAADTVLFFQSRLRFGVLRDNGRQEAASHGSALFGFNLDLTPLHRLGTVVRPLRIAA